MGAWLKYPFFVVATLWAQFSIIFIFEWRAENPLVYDQVYVSSAPVDEGSTKTQRVIANTVTLVHHFSSSSQIPEEAQRCLTREVVDAEEQRAHGPGDPETYVRRLTRHPWEKPLWEESPPEDCDYEVDAEDDGAIGFAVAVDCGVRGGDGGYDGVG